MLARVLSAGVFICDASYREPAVHRFTHAARSLTVTVEDLQMVTESNNVSTQATRFAATSLTHRRLQTVIPLSRID